MNEELMQANKLEICSEKNDLHKIKKSLNFVV